MKIIKLFCLMSLGAILTFNLSCTSNPGNIEAINSASKDRRNIIGIEISNLTDAQRAVARYGGDGVYVSTVIPGRPASLAGIRSGDIIASIDSNPVSDASDTLAVMNGLEGGRRYLFEIYRPLGRAELRYVKAYVLIEKIQERSIGRIS